LSFGEFYPSLVNPLDRTVNAASSHLHKFQYFMSVVPTMYSVGGHVNPDGSSSGGSWFSRGYTLSTNQYAVTEQSGPIGDMNVPGIFFKYDIEPIMLTIEETRDSLVVFLFKVINIISGALVAGHWGFTLTEWAREVMGKRRRQGGGGHGVLGAKAGYED
jgi:hypothetical protein